MPSQLCVISPALSPIQPGGAGIDTGAPWCRAEAVPAPAADEEGSKVTHNPQRSAASDCAHASATFCSGHFLHLITLYQQTLSKDLLC